MAKQRKKLLIVDGYNVLRSGSRYRNAPDEDYTDDTFNAARERQVETLVVTSDATIQDTTFGFGVDRMSADGFSREVGMYYEEARLDETPKVAQKNTVASRIDPVTLAKLKALRDGAGR